MYGAARGGDDTLISGAGDDEMWGDASVMSAAAIGGSDTFSFAPLNGQDTIHDFEQGKDHVELIGLGVESPHTFDGLLPYISSDGTDSVIDFGAGNSITVHGITTFLQSDFIFALMKRPIQNPKSKIQNC